MTHSEPHPHRRSPIVAALVGVLTLGAAVTACAAPGGSKQAAPGRQTFAANTPGAQPRPPAPPIQPWPNPNADYITLAPSRAVPIPGSGQNPTALGPPEAFPDPYRDPQ